MKSLKFVIVPLPGSLFLDTAAAADVLRLANESIEKGDAQSHLNTYEVIFASPNQTLELTMANGMNLSVQHALSNLDDEIDTLFIGGLVASDADCHYPDLVAWLEVYADKVRRICLSGSIVQWLRVSGLLNSVDHATHWSLHSTDLAEKPMHTDILYTKHRNVIACAGMSAVIDLTLMLVEEDLGRSLAMGIAKHMLVYQRRPGTDSQVSNLLQQQFSGKKQITSLQSWIKANLHENLKITLLADKAAMSPRNFARVFQSQTGISPGRYIENLRIESSKRYLEDTDLSIEQIASYCGFGNADTLRKLYLRTFGITPYHYRRHRQKEEGGKEFLAEVQKEIVSTIQPVHRRRMATS